MTTLTIPSKLSNIIMLDYQYANATKVVLNFIETLQSTITSSLLNSFTGGDFEGVSYMCDVRGLIWVVK